MLSQWESPSSRFRAAIFFLRFFLPFRRPFLSNGQLEQSSSSCCLSLSLSARSVHVAGIFHNAAVCLCSRSAGGAELFSMLRNICQEDEIREGTGMEREEASTDEKMDDTFHSYYTRFRAAILSQTERGMAFMTTESETTIFCARAFLAITKQAWGGIRQKNKQQSCLLQTRSAFLCL